MQDSKASNFYYKCITYTSIIAKYNFKAILVKKERLMDGEEQIERVEQEVKSFSQTRGILGKKWEVEVGVNIGQVGLDLTIFSN